MPIRKIVFCVCASVLSLNAFAAELSIAHFMSPKHPMASQVMMPFSEALAIDSGGTLTAKIYPGGELGSGPKEQFKRAVDGVADIAFGIPEYTPNIFSTTNLISLPGFPDNNVEATEMLWAAYDEHLSDEFKRVKLLGLWANDPTIIMSVSKPIASLADIEGMKIRSPGSIGSAALEAWGAAPVNMPISDAYNALATGVVDGIMVGASAIRSFKFNEMVKHYSLGIPGSVSAQYLVMNKGAWDGLSPEQQKIVEKNSGVELSRHAAGVYAKAREVGLKLARETGGVFVELSDNAVKEFSAALEGIYKSVVAEVDNGQAGFDAMSAGKSK